jgi:hypothetical protein
VYTRRSCPKNACAPRRFYLYMRNNSVESMPVDLGSAFVDRDGCFTSMLESSKLERLHAPGSSTGTPCLYQNSVYQSLSRRPLLLKPLTGWLEVKVARLHVHSILYYTKVLYVQITNISKLRT